MLKTRVILLYIFRDCSYFLPRFFIFTWITLILVCLIRSVFLRVRVFYMSFYTSKLCFVQGGVGTEGGGGSSDYELAVRLDTDEQCRNDEQLARRIQETENELAAADFDSSSNATSQRPQRGYHPYSSSHPSSSTYHHGYHHQNNNSYRNNNSSRSNCNIL